MALLTGTIAVLGSIFFTPFLMLLLCIIFLASIGKSIGVRRLYIKLLLMIFEYGRANIETAQKNAGLALPAESEDESHGSSNKTAVTSQQPQINGMKKTDVVLTNGNTISRDDKHILVPDLKNGSDDEATVDKDDFDLSNCFDYIKAGMEAIIEDQVTSRFEAEELKNWNLMTRTNRRYEFISWRLTVIWMCGFIIRYCFLFPLRVVICFFGICWLVASTGLLGTIPDCLVKRHLNYWCYMVAFRVMARALSGTIYIRNKHFRPKCGGVCVANHTSPVDVLILSTDNCYSLVMWLTLCTALVGYLADGPFKQWLNRRISIMCFGILSAALSSVITYHNEGENRPSAAGICVANHTSPIDVLVLMCDNCYSLIGQRHGGFLGVLQRALARASPHIWFERSEVKDRHAVARKLKEHVSNPSNPPILIFPEGTCINNTSVMQFKKGSFEVGSVIYPVAIKYDPRFGDAFWNSSRYSMMQYLYMMMTSWAIVCEVWYLPPMHQKEGESAIDFANRVKGVIAKQGGLVDLVWDGQLKRVKPKKEWMERQQEEFSKRLKVE
ncbi:PREDICTED: glycerol-3-phosphate acyltransferase 3 isoform X3 [Nicrophorus vespilloides]|uniref:Glycerol-3-phosphate acyltransferase 3 isoform X3 n=1 Tax=Nicrophorus vespilloides TaxID=110193 RepID=A0ABM1MUG0_NICVS|nr:PREDICTED: glycerol-3-phosphate acyltransferase 3 isoform X3 [Nicrophorus vespilloides]